MAITPTTENNPASVVAPPAIRIGMRSRPSDANTQAAPMNIATLHSIQITTMLANAALIACHSTSKAIHAPEINKAHSRYAIANSITPILGGTLAFAIMRGILARTR